MSLIFARRPEVRAVSYSDVWSRGDDLAPFSGSVEAALRLAPVYACQRLIADQFAAAPLRGYREGSDGSRQKMSTQPRLVSDPSPVVSAFTWKYQAIASCLARGNTYGYTVSFDGQGFPSQIVWLHPDDVHVDESGNLPDYYYQGRLIDRARVTHIPGFVLPGSVVGISPLKAFRTTIETGLRAQDFGNDWFKNGAVPGGILKNAQQTVTSDVAEAAKSRFKAATRGRDLFVTGSDWDFTALGVPADEARFIETLKMTATQIANVYGVPPERVGGETGSSMTYGNREQDSLDLVTFTLRPWFARFEEALSALLPRPQYLRFNIDAIVRADLLTRMQAHEIATRVGIETQDEARTIEDRAPLTTDQKTEWQDMYRTSSTNTAPTGAPGGNP